MILVADHRHRSFVLSTWVRSVVDSTDVDLAIVHAYEPKVAEANYDAGNIWVETSDGYAIHGWVCCLKPKDGKPGLVHWVYVPPELRGLGVATKLILETVGVSPEVSKCLKSRKAKSPRKSKLPLGKYNPYRVSDR